MAETSGANTDVVVSGVVGRYATALFELAEEGGAVDAVSADASALKEALDASPELTDALSDRSVSRDAMGRVMASLAEKLSLNELTRKFLGVMAAKRRVAYLPDTLEAFQALAAAKRGEATVEVQSATPLSDEQKSQLSDVLAKALDKKVHMFATVDPELIGGLIVKMGSRMIDASIRSKLARLQTAMKEVG